MLRAILGGLVGGLVVFFWGFFAWGFSDIYKTAIKPMPNAPSMIGTLKGGLSETGAYYFPEMPADRHDTAAMESWTTRHTDGPLGMVIYRAHGADPMDPMLMLRGLAIYAAAGLILASLMHACGIKSFGRRWAFAISAALFAVLVSHITKWNWFYFPDAYTLAMVSDVMIGWTLGGAAVAAIVRPCCCGPACQPAPR